MPDSTSLDLTTALTLEAWVYPTANSWWRDVVYKGSDDVYYLASTSETGGPAVGAVSLNGPLMGANPLPLNAWSHIAGTYDGANIRLYVNGVEVARRPHTGNISTSSGALTIGGDALYGQHFAGRIDEVRVYNKALTAAQVQSDMATAINSSSDSPPPPPPPPSESPTTDTQPPTTPSNLRVTSSTTTSTALAWTASTDNVAVAGYRLYLNGVEAWTTIATSFTYLGLTCGTSYVVAVDAYDTAGNRSPQASATVATGSCPDVNPPSTPSGLTASNVTPTSLTLGWNASTDSVGVTGYDIFRNGTKVASVTSTSSTQTGLTCGTSYAFAVVAYDAAGNRSPQGQLTTLTAACSSPPPPPPPPSGAVTLEQPDGGANYYAQFSNALPTDPSYFPIGVWGAHNQTQANMDLDAAAGLNLYVWASYTPLVPAIRADGRFRTMQYYDQDGTVNGSEKTARSSPTRSTCSSRTPRAQRRRGPR